MQAQLAMCSGPGEHRRNFQSDGNLLRSANSRHSRRTSDYSIAASYFAPAGFTGKFTATISCRFANCCSSRVSNNSRPFSCPDAQISARK